MESYLDLIFGLLIPFILVIFFTYLINRSQLALENQSYGQGNGLAIFTFSIMIMGYLVGFFLILLQISLENNQIYIYLALLTCLLALLLPLPIIRTWLSKIISINPSNRVHTFGLMMSMLIPLQMFFALDVGFEELSKTEIKTTWLQSLIELWSQNILFAALGFIGVGLFTRRNWKQSLDRLGLKKISWKTFNISFLLAFVCVGSVLVLSNILVALGFPEDPEVSQFSEKIMEPLFSNPLGVLSIGLAAALGEEIIFRGAILPRFGLLASSLLFALTHTQYGLTVSIVVVFLLGMLLGYIRQRINTTASMVIHATYNIILGVLAYFHIG